MMKKESFTQDVLFASHDFETQKDCTNGPHSQQSEEF